MPAFTITGQPIASTYTIQKSSSAIIAEHNDASCECCKTATCVIIVIGAIALAIAKA